MPNSSNSNSSAARLFEMRSIATAASLFTGAAWWGISNWKLFSKPCRLCQSPWTKAVIFSVCNSRLGAPWRKTDTMLTTWPKSASVAAPDRSLPALPSRYLLKHSFSQQRSDRQKYGNADPITSPQPQKTTPPKSVTICLAKTLAPASARIAALL